MPAQTFLLKTANARSRMKAAWEFACRILEHGKSALVTVEEAQPKRSIEQNQRMWAVLGDIASQVDWFVDGKLQRLPPEDWKEIFTAALRKHQRIAQNVDGTGFVILGARTSRMKVGEMCDLITLMEAFGAERRVRWGDDAKQAA